MDVFNLRLPCEEITPKTQGIGAALGQKKIKPVEFCSALKIFMGSKKINIHDTSKIFSKNIIIRVQKTADNFKIIEVNPFIVTEIILQSGDFKGAAKPGKKCENKIPFSLVKRIAEQKIEFSLSDNIDSVINSICGTAKSSGIEINYDL